MRLFYKSSKLFFNTPTFSATVYCFFLFSFETPIPAPIAIPTPIPTPILFMLRPRKVPNTMPKAIHLPISLFIFSFLHDKYNFILPKLIVSFLLDNIKVIKIYLYLKFIKNLFGF